MYYLPNGNSPPHRQTSTNRGRNAMGSSFDFIIAPPDSLSFLRSPWRNWQIKASFMSFISFFVSRWQHTMYAHLKIGIFQPNPFSRKLFSSFLPIIYCCIWVDGTSSGCGRGVKRQGKKEDGAEQRKLIYRKNHKWINEVFSRINVHAIPGGTLDAGRTEVNT